MKKLTLILVLEILPGVAYAARNSPSSCESTTTIPEGYCCISYIDGSNTVERLWKCDNLSLSASSMAECKSVGGDCINYCYKYDLYGDTCVDKVCDTYTYQDVVDSEDCTILNAVLCDYTLVCDGCGNCHRENERVFECVDEHWFTDNDFTRCLKCPGGGLVDFDMGNTGIVACYIPREIMTGSDETGTFKYINDKCYYKKE